MHYQRMPYSTFKTLKETEQYTAMAGHIQPQVEQPRFKVDLEKLRRIPQEVQNIYSPEVFLLFEPRASVSFGRTPAGRHCPWEPTALHKRVTTDCHPQPSP
jgi:hypothetical protein